MGRGILTICCSSAVIHSNDGSDGLKDIFHNLKNYHGELFGIGSAKKDFQRISIANKQSSEHSKKRLKQFRSIKTKYIAASHDEGGGESYKSGAY